MITQKDARNIDFLTQKLEPTGGMTIYKVKNFPYRYYITWDDGAIYASRVDANGDAFDYIQLRIGKDVEEFQSLLESRGIKWKKI